MESNSAIISVPRVGSFDEESCRYFLREVGRQIVPFYPFAFGIDEVYTLLLERYGEYCLADALSVLHELMEADDNASGLGDDGDIWRSWRHSWRHRNDDPSKPFTPTVCGFILPPPTSQSRRRARAASFSIWVAAPLEASGELSGETASTLAIGAKGDTASPEATTSNIGKSSLGRAVRLQESHSDTPEDGRHTLSTDKASRRSCEVDSDKEEADSQQDFDEVQHLVKSINFDNSQLISFEMLTPPSGMRGGNVEIRTLRPVRTMRTHEESPLSVKHQRRISQSTSCQASNLLCEQLPNQREDVLTRVFFSSSSTNDTFLSSDRSWSMDFPTTVLKGRTTNAPGATGQADALQNPRAGHSHTGLDLSSCTMPITPRKTVANRYARLIDGAIFTVKHRGSMDPSFRGGSKSDAGETKRSVRASWSTVRQKELSRHSLLQSVRGIFQRDQQPQQQDLGVRNSHRRQSSLLHNALDRGCDMVSPRSTVASTTPSRSITPHVRPHSRGLDGTFDEQPGLPESSLNLNKALPASPGNPGDSKPPSSRTGTPSFERSQGTPVRPSTASSVSSGISVASSKRDFRALTRGLIDEDMGARRPDLSPVREAEFLSPKKYNPRQSMQSSIYSENSSKGTKSNDASSQDPIMLTPGIPLPLSVWKKEDMRMSPEAPRMSSSLSLPNVQAYTPTKRPEEAVSRATTPSRYNANTHEGNFEPDTTARGRTPYRPLSPKYAVRRPTTNTTPQKRSRSPVKKFLGQFGKSTSLKNIANEPRSKSNSTLAEKSTTTPLKSWGNRFRHGFLTTDFETEEEPHDTSSSSQKVTPSPPQHSTFPISLDPPYQAKILSEIELMICYHANNFLMQQWKAGRLSDDSIAKTKHTWTAKNRPQVLEFMYDQVTQRELIASNLRNVHFHGECGQNPQVLNAALYNWKSMATEMAVRTFCSADSAIKKYMHDSHKVIEMLGAPANTFLALQDLQIRTLTKIAQKQRERMERNTEQQTPSKQSGSVGRRVGTPTPIFGHTPKSGSIEVNPSPSFEQAFETYENSRGGRLGMMVRDMAKEDHK